MKKLLLIGLIFLGANISFADDIWFVSPQPGQNVNGTLSIQIQPPYNNVNVRVWIEYDMGRDQVVWSGNLTAKNNYTITVDTTRFKPGKYEVKAEYYIHGDDMDGDVTFWIGTADSPNGGQYFPQQ